jgi:putative ABC transport system ATP-binding protein
VDGETGAQVIRLMFDLAANRGATLVLITHDPALAARCDRAIRLVDGQIESHDDTRTTLRPLHASGV